MDCTVQGVTKSQTRWSNYYSSLNRVGRPEGGALMPWDGSRTQKEETLLLFSSNNSGREKSWTLFTIALPYYFFPSIKAFFFPCYVGPCTWLAIFQFSSVQSLIHVWLFVTPWTAACQASLSITSSQNLLKFTSIKLVMLSHHLILCRPLLLPPSIFPSIWAFSNESVLHIRWPKYWSFSVSISLSNEYSGLISFRIDWLDLLVVQGTLKSLLQHHSSKASTLWLSAFSIVQLSHPYMTTGKTIALTRQTFVGKVMSLLFNTLSKLVIVFLPRSKHLLISWL